MPVGLRGSLTSAPESRLQYGNMVLLTLRCGSGCRRVDAVPADALRTIGGDGLLGAAAGLGVAEVALLVRLRGRVPVDVRGLGGGGGPAPLRRRRRAGLLLLLPARVPVRDTAGQHGADQGGNWCRRGEGRGRQGREGKASRVALPGDRASRREGGGTRTATARTR